MVIRWSYHAFTHPHQIVAPHLHYYTAGCARCSDAHVPYALRIGDWKLIANQTFDKFQLYEIQRDWREKNNLAAEKPAKLAELKKAFFEVLNGIEKEGPSEWWKKEPPRKRSPKNSRN